MATFRQGPSSGLVLFLVLTLTLQWTQGVKIQQKEKEVLDNLLKSYDVRIRPTGINSTSDTAATVVSLNPYILDLSKVDDKHMEITLQMYFRQRWNDERLRFSDMGGTLKYLFLNDPSKIWTPDLFFPNERKAATHELMRHNAFIRIHPNGNILYSTRISVTLACPMSFSSFPFDSQVCNVEIESYSMKFEEMQLKWKEDTPVAVSEEAHTLGFHLIGFHTSQQDIILSTGKYSRLQLRLLLKRSSGYYVPHLFIPSAMVVIISWIAFWLDSGAITARVVLAVTTLLALSHHTSNLAVSSPRTSYCTSSDLWLGVCFTFVFAALLETATVHYWHRAEQKRGQKAVADTPSDEVAVTYQADAETSTVRVQEGNGKLSTLKKRASDLKSRLDKISTKSKRLDVISRICFPIGFALFVIVYVIWVAKSKMHEGWE